MEGNEIVDLLAKAAAENQQGEIPVIPRSLAFFRAEFKDHLYERWIKQWRDTDISFARQTKIWFPEPSFRKTRRLLLSLPRPAFSQAVRWLSGHAFLGLQNFRCGSTAVSFCRVCGQVPERADHILLRCQGFNNLRAFSFSSWNLDPIPVWEVTGLLRFLEDPRVAALEDPTNSPEDISGREESDNGARSGESTDTSTSF